MAADTSVILRRDPVEKQWVVVPLADPAEDRLFWFNGSSGLPDYLSIGSGLAVSGSSLIGQHNELTQLQGGAVGEYYHLTGAQHVLATQIGTSTQTGLISSTDWNTFNNKEPAITTLPVTKGGTGIPYKPRPIESDAISSGISSSTYDAFGITLIGNSGKIVIVYRAGLTHVSSGDNGVISTRQSTDQGLTWSAANTIFSSSGFDCRNVAGGVTSTGRFVIFFGRLDTNTAPFWKVWPDWGYMYSDDEGVTWSPYTTISKFSQDFVSPYGAMIELADGRLMQTWYGDTAISGSPAAYTAFSIFSTDNGLTWGDNTVIASSTTDRFSECSCAYIGGKSVVGLIRIDNGTSWRQVKSTDNGASWTSQGDIAFDSFTETTPPWLSTFQDIDGLITTQCFWYNRDTFDLKVISGRSLLSGTSGWNDNTIEILASGSVLDSGYPSVVRSGAYAFGWWYKRVGSGLAQITFFKTTSTRAFMGRLSVNGGRFAGASDGLVIGNGVRITRTSADGFFNFERHGAMSDGDVIGSFGGVGLDSSSVRKQFGGVFFNAYETDGIGEVELKSYNSGVSSALLSAFKVRGQVAYLPGYTTQGILSVGSDGIVQSGLTTLYPTFDGVNSGGMLIVRGNSNIPSTGEGLEIQYGSDIGRINVYDRTADTFKALYIDGSELRLQTESGGATIFGSTIKTASPSGGTAQPWKLGNYTAGVATQAGKVRVEINGTPYDLLTA